MEEVGVHSGTHDTRSTNDRHDKPFTNSMKTEAVELALTSTAYDLSWWAAHHSQHSMVEVTMRIGLEKKTVVEIISMKIFKREDM
ncbi:hypothetical protein J6590_079431 [Homalodisca vitripennis]|nr:hypothetical protein J6590_079431 [Homalodisca vitripennis]